MTSMKQTEIAEDPIRRDKIPIQDGRLKTLTIINEYFISPDVERQMKSNAKTACVNLAYAQTMRTCS
jgi:hypothetical protein